MEKLKEIITGFFVGAIVLSLLLGCIAVFVITFGYCIWNWTKIWSSLAFYSIAFVCAEGGLRLLEQWLEAVFYPKEFDTGEILKWSMVVWGVGLFAIVLIYLF